MSPAVEAAYPHSPRARGCKLVILVGDLAGGVAWAGPPFCLWGLQHCQLVKDPVGAVVVEVGVRVQEAGAVEEVVVVVEAARSETACVSQIPGDSGNRVWLGD